MSFSDQLPTLDRVIYPPPVTNTGRKHTEEFECREANTFLHMDDQMSVEMKVYTHRGQNPVIGIKTNAKKR